VSVEETRDSILVKETWRGEADPGFENDIENEQIQNAAIIMIVP
jgi:hypothetical protein